MPVGPLSSLGICARKAACVREIRLQKSAAGRASFGAKTKDLGEEPGKSAERGREAERGAGRRVGAGADGLCTLDSRSEFFEAANGGRKRAEVVGKIPAQFPEALPVPGKSCARRAFSAASLRPKLFPAGWARPAF